MRHGSSRVEYTFHRGREYVASALAKLTLATVVLSLLPIPAITLQLLPTYTMHARFLIFYTPLACLLVMGYLLYIREIIARIMFADLFEEEEPEPDPYHRAPIAHRARIMATRALTTVFKLLPAILLAVSLYCVSRYVDRFNDSVAIASGVLASQIPLPLPGDSVPAGPGPTGLGRPLEPSPEEVLRRHPALAADPNPLRTFAMTTAMIGDIPHFAELTAFYIGAIACPLAAVFLVLLKEYSRATLKLTEEEVLGGRVSEESLPGDVEGVGPPGQ